MYSPVMALGIAFRFQKQGRNSGRGDLRDDWDVQITVMGVIKATVAP